MLVQPLQQPVVGDLALQLRQRLQGPVDATARRRSVNARRNAAGDGYPTVTTAISSPKSMRGPQISASLLALSVPLTERSLLPDCYRIPRRTPTTDGPGRTALSR